MANLQSDSARKDQDHESTRKLWAEKLKKFEQDRDDKDRQLAELSEGMELTRLQHQQQLEAAEAKNKDLRYQIKAASEVGRLQRECDRIYQVQSLCSYFV